VVTIGLQQQLDTDLEGIDRRNAIEGGVDFRKRNVERGTTACPFNLTSMVDAVTVALSAQVHARE
jgi:hypothetical protein